MDKVTALKEINDTQNYYVNQLIDIILSTNKNYDSLKEIDFTSPTGTGKTIMMSKIINKLPNFFFVVTSLSRGQLRYQVEDKIEELVESDNYIVFGLSEYTKNTVLQYNDYIMMLPTDKPIIWFRDEGHIATNRWQEILRQRSEKIINFSATNKTSNGIQCNFTHTMMLRTVKQFAGTPDDAINKLLEVKKNHRAINGYNPCLLARSLDSAITEMIIDICKQKHLKYINITDEMFDMSDLCRDDNEYDVIINKFKITEGIDLRRCHVIYMDTRPGNDATTVQVIGRARRNALFWRDDVDIMDQKNQTLLQNTRECYVYYNVPEAQVGQTESGELSFSLCDLISIEELKPNIEIYVENGRLPNGLYLIELEGKTGKYKIKQDDKYGFNVIDDEDFYKEVTVVVNEPIIHGLSSNLNIKKIALKPNAIEFLKETNPYGPIFDERRRNFYYLSYYCQANGFDIDEEYWSKFLELDDLSKPLEKKTYMVFRRAFGKYFNSYEYRRYVDKNYKEMGRKCRDKVFLTASYKLSARRSINYSYGYNDSGSNTILNSFKKYIEYVEYYDVRLALKIQEAISKFDGSVEYIGDNKFRYSPNHPGSYFLYDYKGIGYKELKKMVQESDDIVLEKTKMTKQYLTQLLKNITNIRQIDNYETYILDFAKLNNMLNLGFSDEEVRIYAEGNYPFIKTNKDFDFPIAFHLENGKYMRNEVGCLRNYIYLCYSDVANPYTQFKLTFNDYDIAMIGPHKCRYYGGEYSIDKPVTSKLRYYSKFNLFITKKYAVILESVKGKLSPAEGNFFSFDKRCNSAIGYCVECFAKIKLYGEQRYADYINIAKKELKTTGGDAVLVRAATLIYVDEMKRVYGSGVSMVIPTVTVNMIISRQYDEFIRVVSDLGNKTCKFIAEKMYSNVDPKTCVMYDPNLSVKYTSGLADFITEDTILDLKCTGGITESHIKQVLAYYYLSTKRSDLKIKRLVVYDAVTEKYIEINLDQYGL